MKYILFTNTADNIYEAASTLGTNGMAVLRTFESNSKYIYDYYIFGANSGKYDSYDFLNFDRSYTKSYSAFYDSEELLLQEIECCYGKNTYIVFDSSQELIVWLNKFKELSYLK